MLSDLVHRLPFSRLRWHLARRFSLNVPESLLRRNIARRFFKRLGYVPDIDAPKTFNEKMQWLKLNYRNSMMPVCADKYAVREFIGDKGLPSLLTKLIFHGEDFTALDFSSLPQQFVVKPTHNSGSVSVVRDKQKCDWELVKKTTLKSMSRLYEHGLSQGEWHYFSIPARVVVEEYLDDGSGGVMDYKIHCMNGVPRYVQIDLDRFRNHTRTYFTPNWEPLPFTTTYPRFLEALPKPKILEQMLLAARTLSEDFPYVRVDFYITRERLLFGEMTFFHDGGFAKFDDARWDMIWGTDLTLGASCKKKREFDAEAYGSARARSS
jgi:hypothetical protein